jgi:hypothetical protein
MPDEFTCSGWACTDCIMLLANGDTSGTRDHLSESEFAAWEREIETRNAGYNITCGMGREEHACATNFTVTTEDGKEYDYRATDAEDARDKLEFDQSYTSQSPIVSVTEHELATRGDLGGECECETDSFSWSPCDVCGGNLGGERHAVSFWKILDA